MKFPNFLRKGGVDNVPVKNVVEKGEIAQLQAGIREDVEQALASPTEGRLEQVWNVLSNASAKAALLTAAGTLEGCGPITGNGYADTAIIGSAALASLFALVGFKFLKPSEFIIIRNRWAKGINHSHDQQGGLAWWFRPLSTPWAINEAQPDDVTIDGTEKTLPNTGDWKDEIEIGLVPVNVSWSVVVKLVSPKQMMFALGSDWQRTQERIKDLTNRVLIEHFGNQSIPANATPDVVVQNIMNNLAVHADQINQNPRINKDKMKKDWGIELEILLGPVSEKDEIQQSRMALEQAGINVRIAQTNIEKAKAEGQAVLAKAQGEAQAQGTILKAKIDALQGADPIVASVMLAADSGAGGAEVAKAAITAGAIKSVAQSGINVNLQSGSGTGTPGSGTGGGTTT